MPNKKISSLTEATAVTIDDTLYILDGVTSKKVTAATTRKFMSPWYNVKDFGALGDGVTDDTAAIQATIDAALAGGGGVFIPAGTFVVTSPLDLCDITTGLYIRGANYGATKIYGQTTNKAVFEIIGSIYVTIENIMVRGHTVNTPMCAFWTGRSVAHSSSALLRFNAVYCEGYFTTACWLNTGSESNYLKECLTYPSNAACKAGILYDYRNAVSGILPTHTTLTTTYDATLCHLDNCHLTCAATATAFQAVYVYAGNGPRIDNCYLVSYGGAAVYLRGGCSNGLQINRCVVEGNTRTHIIRVTDDATYNVPGKVTRMTLYAVGGSATVAAIECDTTTTLRDSSILNCTFLSNVIFGTLESCDFPQWAAYDGGATSMTVANAYNSFIGLNLGDTLTITGSVSNVIVDDSSAAAQPYSFVKKPIKIGTTYNGATLASISQVLTASATWDVASLADGAAASTFVAITGVTTDGTWVCSASLSSITAAGWLISAYPYAGGVRAVVMNKTGAPVDLASGTLRVVAIKVA